MVEIAQRYGLDRRYTAKTSGWQALKEFERERASCGFGSGLCSSRAAAGTCVSAGLLGGWAFPGLSASTYECGSVRRKRRTASRNALCHQGILRPSRYTEPERVTTRPLASSTTGEVCSRDGPKSGCELVSPIRRSSRSPVRGWMHGSSAQFSSRIPRIISAIRTTDEDALIFQKR